MKSKSLSWYKKQLWKVFSAFIKARDKGICFTCGRKARGSGYHAGHFIKASIGGLALYFSEINVHGQCYNCNINLDGNQYEYGIRLGLKKVKFLYSEKLKRKGEIWSRADYEVLTAYYIEALDALLMNLAK